MGSDSDSDGSESVRQKRADKLRAKLGQRNMLLALEKKKRCNARAQLIVEEFLEVVRDSEYFVEKLQYICQTHYDDIVEERSIERHCGYPLCPGQLKNVPSKQFHICRTSNTVYDITERKKFCSTECFRASNYIRAQLLTSPLWLRDSETVPEFRLMDEWRSPADDEPTVRPCSKPAEVDDQLHLQMQRMKLDTQTSAS